MDTLIMSLPISHAASFTIPQLSQHKRGLNDTFLFKLINALISQYFHIKHDISYNDEGTEMTSILLKMS